MADLPAELAKAKPKTKAWLNKLRAVVKENAIVAGKSYTVTKHPGGTELVIDVASLIPGRAACRQAYILGSTLKGTNSDDPLHPDPPNANLLFARLDVYDFGKPISNLEGVVTDGVEGYLTRFYTSTMISFVAVFRRKILCNDNGTMNYISEETADSVTLAKG